MNLWSFDICSTMQNVQCLGSQRCLGEGGTYFVMWRDYRKYLPGQVIRIRQKIKKKGRLFLNIFSSAIMNDLTMTFTSRLKMDAKYANQQWNRIRAANYFGTPPDDWVQGYLCFEPGAWIWTKVFRRYLRIVKKSSEFFSLNSARVRVRAFGWPFLGILSGFF